MLLRSLVALTVVLSSASAIARGKQEWNTYRNDRYGYSICYPVALFRPGPDPDAHDGVVFLGPSGAILTVHGGYNVTSDTPASAAANELSAAGKGSVHVTYQAAGNGWAVASGTLDDQIIFVRQSVKNDVIAGFEIVYPAGEKLRYDGIVKRINSCLKL